MKTRGTEDGKPTPGATDLYDLDSGAAENLEMLGFSLSSSTYTENALLLRGAALLRKIFVSRMKKIMV